ncbi:MAG TPA: UbiA family prenyltransferase [Phycisphaerales bacterium]|nr:UbiA family prenyltransferase [Phycisphaerales bacterium]HMP38075.1 UbiA family prenyltransferase [Phycisphaerales bacterium]
MSAAPEQRPLYVDLDGTLISSDTLWELFVVACRRRPLRTPVTCVTGLLRGRAALKQDLGRLASLRPEALPYRSEVVEFLQAQRHAGRRIVLATAADRSIAEGVAGHLRLFDDVLASDGLRNLKGPEKLRAIREQVGAAGFDYIGDSAADEPIWEAATHSFRVGPPRPDDHRFARVFAEPRSAKAILRLLRPHQWVKNLLVFVPLLLAHAWHDPAKLLATLLAFAAISACASGVYVVNDLTDLESDRAHRSKRRRPIAAGAVAIPAAIAVAAGCFALSLGLALLVNWPFVGVLAAYFAVTTLYSLRLKRRMLLDVIVLASLYTVRVIAGGVAAEVEVSPWLLAFSMFLFFSLALAKRYAELAQHPPEPGTKVAGRGYVAGDLQTVGEFGVASGLLSVLVLSLYVSESATAAALYPSRALLWMLCPLLLYWIARLWFITRRGGMHEDPILFAIKDRASWLVALIAVALVGLATTNLFARPGDRARPDALPSAPAAVDAGPLTPAAAARGEG